MNTDKKNRGFLFYYSIMFFIVICIGWGVCIITKSCFVLAGDGYNQFYPSFVYIGEYIRNVLKCLLSGDKIPMYDFSIGYGGDILTTLSYYGFGDIFNVLSAFAPARYASIAYTFVTVLKLYLAGTAFFYCMKRIYSSKTEYVKIMAAGAIVYVFSAYSISTGILFPSFENAMITLPLIIAGLNNLLLKDEKRISKVLIFALAVQSLCGFYILYMELIFCIIYCFCVVILGNIHTIKNFLLKVFFISLQVLLGIGCGGVFLYPVVLAYLSSPRTGESSVNISSIISLCSLESAAKKISGLLTGPGYGSGLGLCAAAVVAVIAVYSLNNKCKELLYPELRKAMRVLLIIVGIGYFWSFWGSLMNGLSYTTDRWIFMISFMTAWAVTDMGITLLSICDCKSEYSSCLNRFILNKKTGNRSVQPDLVITVLLSIIVLIIWGVLYAVYCGISVKNVMHFVIIALTFAAVICAICNKNAKLYVYMCVMGAAVMVFYNNAPHIVGGEGYYKAYQNAYLYDRIMDSSFAKESIDSQSRHTFARTDIYDSSFNASLVTGTKGTASYFSLCNPSLDKFMRGYMVSGGIQGSTFTMQGLEGRQALESLLSVDMYSLNNEDDGIFENRIFMPLGFTYDKYISEEVLGQDSALYANEVIPYALILAEDVVEEHSDILASVQKVQPESTEVTINISGEPQGDLELDDDTEYTVVPEKQIYENDKEYYLCFKDFIYNGNEILRDIDINGKSIRLRPLNSYAGQQNDFLVKVDRVEEYGNNIKVSIPAGNYTLGNIELKCIDVSGYKEAFSEKNTLDDLVVNGRSVSGDIEISDKSELLFMSILYDKGWKCYIDGNETDVIPVNYGFLSVIVPEGKHSIVFEYSTYGIGVGAVISVMSLLAVMVWYILGKMSIVHSAKKLN